MSATESKIASAAERALGLEIEGDAGQLSLSNYIVPHFGCTLRLEIAGSRVEEEAEGISTYEAQLAHVADVLLRGATPMTGGEDAIANMRVIDAIRARSAPGKAGENCIDDRP